LCIAAIRAGGCGNLGTRRRVELMRVDVDLLGTRIATLGRKARGFCKQRIVGGQQDTGFELLEFELGTRCALRLRFGSRRASIRRFRIRRRWTQSLGQPTQQTESLKSSASAP
jgi:hypothetical protein